METKRGTLKIYLGYAVGVGKTFGMLTEAHRLLDRGIDTVIGYVEPHGRIETVKKMEGIEVVPQKEIRYRGIVLKETDALRIIERHPSVALVDEIAHTNAPGSDWGKRFRDIALLQDAGISVITTLNIQHIESLAPSVEGNLGVRVSERVPDEVVIAADSIVNVDISVRELLKRLEDGKIYDMERVVLARNNFFRKENLKYLRELLNAWLKTNNRTAG